jgi:hypothetical protein
LGGVDGAGRGGWELGIMDSVNLLFNSECLRFI